MFEKILNIIKRTEDKVFPIMNVRTEINDARSENDKSNDIIKKYEQLKPALGNVILHSDGSIKEGFDPDLKKCNGLFNLSSSYKRIRLSDEFGGICSDYYFFKGKQVFVGSELDNSKTLKPSGHISKFSLYNTPVFNLPALYKKMGFQIQKV